MTNYLINDLIDGHCQSRQIKRIQRLAYRGISRVHKQGVDALCLLTGPLGGSLFSVFDDHREQDRENCASEAARLFKDLDANEENRIIAIHLLNTHPGKIRCVADLITRWLSKGSNQPKRENTVKEKIKASEVVAPEEILDPSDITRWEFFDRGKQVCEFKNYQSFLNMSSRLVQGAPFPLDDVVVRFHTSKGRSVDVSFPKIAKQLFE